MNWEEPQDICGAVLLATGPWKQRIDIQVRRGGAWVSAAQSGSAAERTPEHAIVAFKPQRTSSLRFVFVGGAAYYEVEVYKDAAVIARLAAEQFSRARIVAAGDLRGHLMGIVSLDEGTYRDGYHYGPGRTVKTGEVREGTVRLKLLAEPKSY